MLRCCMVELPVTVYEQNNQKGIVVIFTIILLVIPFLISGLQLNHVLFEPRLARKTKHVQSVSISLLSYKFSPVAVVEVIHCVLYSNGRQKMEKTYRNQTVHE